MAGRKNMGYKTRYTFQVTAEQDAVFQRELKFQREEEAAGTRCTETASRRPTSGTPRRTTGPASIR
jgi:hypothetical protein